DENSAGTILIFSPPSCSSRQLTETPDWCIGCEGRSWVPAFEAEQIVGDLHDPLSDRLAPAGLPPHPKPTPHLGLIDGRLVVGIVGRIGPSGRTVCGGCHSATRPTSWPLGWSAPLQEQS